VDDVLAVLEDPHDDDVRATARALADLVSAGTRSFDVPEGAPADRVAAVVAALGRDVVAAVLSDRRSSPLCWTVVQRTGTPVLVLPRAGTGAPAGITRVLLPLDGSPGTAAGVAPWARWVLAGGARLLPVHVFDPDTVPAFWDQAAHSGEHWTEEFLRRNLPAAADLDLCRGATPEQVVATARRERADLVLIGWGGDLAEGRAATVRHLLTRGTAPVLLVPTGAGPSRPSRGPSALDRAGGGVAG
jgi:hypothetical protein